MAQPLALIPTLGNVVPALEWHQYQRLADDLEETTNRIAILTAAMKRRGVRDAAITELEKLAKANDNEFIAVKDYQQFVTKGGLAQAFQTEDLRPIVETMMHLYKAKTEQEATIDKMTGIADIMRGESDSSATATAENIKAQYGGLRIKTRQKEVEAFIRDNMRIEAEMIAEHFEADILFKMTEIEVSDELIAMLRDDHARRYKIDIETDSTVFEDAEGQKAATSEAITASVSLMREGVGMMQVAPEMGEVIFEMLTMALKTMKGGRSIEEVIDRARQAMQQRISAPPPEQQPDPIAEADKARAEAAQFDAQSKMELTDLKMQAGREKHAQTMERMQANRMFSDFEPPMTGAVQ